MQQLKGCIDAENVVENTREENNSELDMDEDMMLAGLSMFETDFWKESNILKIALKCVIEESD